MALTLDLMAFGLPAALADLEGNNAAASVTAAGTTATDATVLTTGQNLVVLTGTGSDGIKLPAGAALAKPYIISCISGGAKVYPPTSGQLNGGTATTGSITVGANKSAIAIRYSSTGWFFNLSA